MLTRFAKTGSLLLLLLLTGCASSGLTQWLGWQPAPQTVAGLNATGLEQLGVAHYPACETLYFNDFSRYWPPSTLSRLRTDCAGHVRAVLTEKRDNKRLDEQIALAWEQIQTEKAEQAEKQRRDAMRRDQLRAIRQSRQEDKTPAAIPVPQAPVIILDRLSLVPDLPLAYGVGQPSDYSLKTFLACLERAYPTERYAIEHKGDQLGVKARGVQMLRGNVTIESHYVQVWDNWVMDQLRVAEMQASTARERYSLATSLLDRCSEIE